MTATLGRRRVLTLDRQFSPRDAERLVELRRLVASGERPFSAMLATLVSGPLAIDRWRRRGDQLGIESVARRELAALVTRGTAPVAEDDADTFDADALVEALVADMHAIGVAGGAT